MNSDYTGLIYIIKIEKLKKKIKALFIWKKSVIKLLQY